jgi:DNA modification methylase
LRDYGVDGQIGLEVTPDAYIANLVEVFRECKRILRDDGTLWVNIGDSYASEGVKQNGRNDAGRNNTNGFTGSNGYDDAGGRIAAGNSGNAKPKDLIGIPWMLAFALRADGWYLRQDIIWAKPNPMPESVKDRCTKSHEYIFLLSKSAKYYYDNEAVKDSAKDSTISRNEYTRVAKAGDKSSMGIGSFQFDHETLPTRVNKRDVWTVTTKPYKGAHYATFNPELIKPCILAGAPETCCAKCGAPYERVVEQVNKSASIAGKKTQEKREQGLVTAFSGYADGSTCPTYKTLGFQPTCTCNAGTSSGIVFDPFVGSGTTVATAIQLGRKGIGIDLSFKYLQENAKVRVEEAELPLLSFIEQ